jgi:hypothetical protein
MFELLYLRVITHPKVAAHSIDLAAELHGFNCPILLQLLKAPAPTPQPAGP